MESLHRHDTVRRDYKIKVMAKFLILNLEKEKSHVMFKMAINVVGGTIKTI